MKLNSVVIIFILLSIASCKKTDDIKPEMVVESPTNEQKIVSGAEITFKAVFKDNNELAQYKIDIHDNFDGHSHKVANEPWAEVIIGELKGKEEEIERKIAIPIDAAAGEYDFIVKCIDVAGNEATLKTLGVIIEN